jgi:hypothetical protein
MDLFGGQTTGARMCRSRARDRDRVHLIGTESRASCVAADPRSYLTLLLCISANLGSGVSGGRCGLMTLLNQASC